MKNGVSVTNNTPLNNLVSNMLPLSNIRRYNTQVEKNLDTTVTTGTVAMVYGPYINSDSETEFSTNIYLPKQLSVTANDIRTLGNGTILAKLIYKNSGNDFAQLIINSVDNKLIIKVEILDYNLGLDDIIYNLVDNVYTRNDNINGYRMVALNNDVIYSTSVDIKSISYEILQCSASYQFNGLYLYNVSNWEPLPLGVTANISTIFNGYTALTDDGIVTGIGTSDATAIAGDIWKNTAYAKGEKITGTLQVTQNVTRQELDSKVDMWNTFTNFSTISNDLSYLMNNLPQKLLPTITANDVVNVTGMYNNCKNLIEVDITKLNTINTTNMDNMFSNCSNLINLNLNSFKTNNLQSTSGMFDNCVNISSIDVTNWNVSNLKDTTSMFENCKNLTNLNVSKWNTYNVETMGKMFRNCQKMENISFTNWNTSNVSNMEAIFESCDRFTNSSLQNIVTMLPDAIQLTNTNAFNLGIDMDRYTAEQIYSLYQKNYTGAPLPYNMYYNIVNLDDGTYYLLNKGDNLDKNGVKLRGYISSTFTVGQYANIKIGDNISKEGTIQKLGMEFASSIKNIESIDISDLNISNVNNLSYTFYVLPNLKTVNVSKWDISKVTDIGSMFCDCEKVNYINVSQWNTINIKNMAYMFMNCYNLDNLDVSNWDVSNVINMGNLFLRCTNLKHLDLSNWDVSNVNCIGKGYEGMYSHNNSIFNSCISIDNLDLSNWNLGKVTDVVGMFANCINLTNLNIKNMNLTNVIHVDYMFSSCRNLTEISLPNCNYGNVVSVAGMFQGCSNLTTINWNNISFDNVQFLYGMFMGCNNLNLLCVDFPNWNKSNFKHMDYMFYGCNIGDFVLANENLSNMSEMGHMLANTTGNSIKFINCDFGNCYTCYDIFANLKVGIDSVSVINCNLSNIYTSEWFTNSRSIKNIYLEDLYLPKLNLFPQVMAYLGIQDITVKNIIVPNQTATGWVYSNCRSLMNVLIDCNYDNVTSMDSMFAHCYNLVNVNISNLYVPNLNNISAMFTYCNNLSDASIDSIINMCLNATNVTYKTLYYGNQYSPFYKTNIVNTRYQSRWSELTNAGWTY